MFKILKINIPVAVLIYPHAFFTETVFARRIDAEIKQKMSVDLCKMLTKIELED